MNIEIGSFLILEKWLKNIIYIHPENVFYWFQIQFKRLIGYFFAKTFPLTCQKYPKKRRHYNISNNEIDFKYYNFCII